MSSFHLHDIQRKTGKFIRKFGTHDDVDSGTAINEAVWSYADVAGDYVFPSDSGETMYISSSNDLDTIPITILNLKMVKLNFFMVEAVLCSLQILVVEILVL